MTDKKEFRYLESEFARLIGKINGANSMNELRILCRDSFPLYQYQYVGDGDRNNLLQGIANSIMHRVLSLASIPSDSFMYQWWGWTSWYKTTDHYKQLPYRYSSLRYEPGLECTDEQWNYYNNQFRNVIFTLIYDIMLATTHGEILYFHNKAVDLLSSHSGSFCRGIAALSGSDVSNLNSFIALRIFVLNDLVNAGRIALNWFMDTTTKVPVLRWETSK